MTNAIINSDLKKYTKKYVVEDNTFWEVFDDNISKAEVIWDMENIADLFNKLVEENEELKKRNEWLITQISNLTMNMYKLGIKIELEDEDGNSFDFMEMILND